MAVAAGPVLATQPWSLQDGIPLGVYPPSEQDFVLRTQRATARMQEATTDYQRGPPQGPGVKGAPMIHRPTTYAENVNNNSAPHAATNQPVMYNTPRRLSNSSTVSTASSSGISGREVFDSRVRSASMSSSQTSISQTSVESSYPKGPGGTIPRSPTASYTNWQTQGVQGGQYPWQRPAQIKPQRRKAAQGELFAALPGEVLEMILDELRRLHLKPSSTSCATCWMRDCCSVALGARKFLKYAREALYQHIHLQGHEGPNMKKRTKSTYGSRLTLLRRTLRSNQQIAVIVRSLKPPALPQGVVDVEKYNDLVASVVMACPNLERLLGYYPTYNHSFRRLYQALSTRPKLKEMNWVLEPSPSQQQQRSRPTGPSQHWGPVDLTPQESRMFLDFHINWKQLSTLVIHCHLGATLSPPKLLERTIRSLPALKTLILSHIPSAAFGDSTLLSLPSLTKLSLTHCAGVTTPGLSAMATRPTSASLETLTLMHMNLESLPTLARLFSNLVSLETFNLVQAYSPNMDPNEFLMLFPYLASRTLRKLHWDIPYLPNAVTPADTILARSIEAGGFPALRYLCTPNDPEGIFQRLCCPRERIDQPMDRYRGGPPANNRPGSAMNPVRPGSSANLNASNRPGTASGWSGFGMGHTRNSSSYSSSTGRGSFSFMSRGGGGGGEGGNNSAPASPMFASSEFNMSLGEMMTMPRDNSNLHQARMAAQQRLETARRVPRYFINVFDEGGNMVDKFGVGAFMGSVESKIQYVLVGDPSKGQTDEGGGLVSVEDMLRDDGGEALVLGGEAKDGKEKKKKSSSKEAAEDETKTREGCIGRWNTFSGNVVDKKDKERWWHAERGRWRAVVLS
ncbi:hypothetical protein QBC44DRAFT_249867 [Cladorrhinum sp. PSN332]|nr:hypothetical protein QBC44DRAFT_249867 [Cladorrhinum sp. PSN332]